MQLPNPRLYLIERMRQELLGPRGGPSEALSGTDPREEYIVGVLDSATAEKGPEDDLELLEAEDIVNSGQVEEDEDEAPDPLLLAAEFAPSVDPRRLPCSIGLTFFVESSAQGRLEVAVSGGRYQCNQETWRRISHTWRTEPLPPSLWDEDFTDDESGFKVVLRSRQQGVDLYRVSVYLLNTGNWSGRSKERASRFLYQPQIRVLLSGKATLKSLSEGNTERLELEEQRLQLLYRKQPVMARGHMCAAVWRDIDPELEPDSPFRWIDQTPALEAFADCDVRTELLPMLAVPTPFADWRENLGPSPERQAVTLSETPQEDLKAALEPLTDAYEAWLVSQETSIPSLPEAHRALAAEQLVLGREALGRMRAGIALISNDPQAYLAFCFANRAVHEQASWAGETPLAWRPFQLGFLLLCLPGLADPSSSEREVCDLLWFPTGGGKTEAYLALTAFVLGLRRLRHPGYDGVGVMSRYTLRLLSIQQFRRALKLITACEMLRVTPMNGQRGWRPPGVASGDWLWGKHRFSAGLWLGGAVTPNQLEGNAFHNYPGGFDLLETSRRGGSDPAQVTECPVCGAVMALPDEAESDTIALHLRVSGLERTPLTEELSTAYVKAVEVKVTSLTPAVSSLRLKLWSTDGSTLDPDGWWEEKRTSFGDDCVLLCARPSRPGYFIEQAPSRRGQMVKQRIELFCPDPDCPTSRHPWQEMLPLTISGEAGKFQTVHSAVAVEPTVGRQCPIPAVMVDDQIYAQPPSLLISTVDKFARLAFEPRAANLFGNVEYYHAHEGFYREGCLRQTRSIKSGAAHPPHDKWRIEVPPLPPPDLVIQDELHLIDGPLGSMVGLYETAVNRLCGDHKVKYVASTATVREASDQVRALFSRDLRQFPPPSLEAADSFFALMRPASITQATGAGRLYLGYSAPGRGALTPQVRAWAVLLQAAQELRLLGIPLEELDPYWSPVGYFTTIRNLATTGGLWRQAIPQRIQYLGGEQRRELGSPTELSSRVSSSRLPAMLNRLSRPLPNAVDGVLSTSMFGTGVDVSRLSLMLVHGQPKTTSSYIQATGRVGRQSPGLVVVNLPATNARSLDHYEFFTGYHLQLYRGVEPVTVFPFAPRARERALGPLCVALLRQLREADKGWRDRATGARMMSSDWQRPEVQALLAIFSERAGAQPEMRRPDEDALSEEVRAAIETWKALACRESSLVMEEYTLARRPHSPVVLGTPQHAVANLPTAYPKAPQSLREIEATTGFKI